MPRVLGEEGAGAAGTRSGLGLIPHEVVRGTAARLRLTLSAGFPRFGRRFPVRGTCVSPLFPGRQLEGVDPLETVPSRGDGPRHEG